MSLRASSIVINVELPFWQGEATLKYSRQGDKTQVSSAAQAPLKVQRPFYPESDAVCHTVLIHTAGGMVAGDRLAYSVNLGVDAHSLVTTAAAAKVYRSHGQVASQAIVMRLAPGSYLEWLPQETILFNQANFLQTLTVNLEPGAQWLSWDLYRFGRTAGGEQFTEGLWRSQTAVWQHDRPLWIDRQRLVGHPTDLKHPHGLAGYPVIGTLVWLGREVSPEFVQRLRDAWLALGYAGQAGVSRLPLGLVCRYRGPSSAQGRDWFVQIWQQIRRQVSGESACLPRVWPR